MSRQSKIVSINWAVVLNHLLADLFNKFIVNLDDDGCVHSCVMGLISSDRSSLPVGQGLVFAYFFSQHLLCDKGQAAEALFGVHGFEEFPDVDYFYALEFLYLLIATTQRFQQAVHVVVKGVANNESIALNVLYYCLLDLRYVFYCKPIN